MLPAAKSSCAIVSDFVPKRANGNYLEKASFPLDHGRWRATIRPFNVKEDEMAKTKSKIAPAKSSEQREGNRYTRAARLLAKDDTIDVKTLGDRAFMSESTAARCLEAWHAVIAALIEVGRLPDPAKAAGCCPTWGASGIRGVATATGGSRRVGCACGSRPAKPFRADRRFGRFRSLSRRQCVAARNRRSRWGQDRPGCAASQG